MSHFMRVALFSTTLIFGFASLASADDKKPIKPATDKPAKPNKEIKKGQLVEAHVKSVDAAKSTITVTIKDADQTLTVAKDARIVVKGKEAGTLADVKADTRVGLMLSADKKTVLGIKAAGTKETAKPNKEAGVKGEVKSIDAAKNTISVAVGKKGNVVEQTYTLAKDARVAVAGNKNASISDVKPGMQVAFALSDDKKTVVTIKAGEKKQK